MQSDSILCDVCNGRCYVDSLFDRCEKCDGIGLATLLPKDSEKAKITPDQAASLPEVSKSISFHEDKP